MQRGSQKDVKSVFAHVFGHGDLTYHPNGKEIFTCGSDSAVRVFTHSDIDAKPKEINYHKAGVTCLAFNPTGDCLATGGEDRIVALFTYPECQFDQIATKCNSEITHIAFNSTGNLLAIAERDTTIKLVNVLDTKHVTLLKGHTGPVKSIVFDPQNQYLASAGGDGMLRVWKLRDRSTVIAIPCFPTASGDSLQYLRMSWSPSGILAVPGEHKVQCLKRGEWRLTKEYSGHSANISIVAFSPNGKYLATTGEDKRVNVFDCGNKELIGYTEMDTQCTSLSWSTTSNTLAILENFGTLKQWINPIPSHMPAPFQSRTEPQEEKVEKATESTNVNDLAKGGLDDEDDDDENERYDTPTYS
eukprot:1014185-Amorphochlora_amoeboformis.AAC.1